MTITRSILLASSCLIGSLVLAGAAQAQSTASQIQEVVVTAARGQPAIAGAITQVQQAGDISVVNQQLFQRQTPSQNVGQLVNLLPGVNYTSEDPTGLLSGDLRIHGLDCAHLSITIDGSPVNDTGNYACYPGEYLVSELTDRAEVNIGSTQVDSPTASAVGGTLNIVSKVPDLDPSARIRLSGGDYHYKRGYAELDTGAIGPTGLRAYVSANYTDSAKWKGSGWVNRAGADFRLYQPLKGSDFMSLAGTWVSERSIFYYSASRAQLAQYGTDFDYNMAYQTPTARTGVADTVPSNAGPAGSNSNYYALHPNPVDFGSIRGQSKFSLTDRLTLTFDPSFFYTLANGGGATGVSETDPRLRGTTGRGVDLNGDGDTLDTVLLYTPSNTNTRRYVVLASLLYDISDQHHVAVSYTYDYGRHRQTGEYTYIDQFGNPLDPFGGKDGHGPRVMTSDGSYLRGRDRYSIAKLNQVSANYLGRFLDDRLHVNVGVRAPYFERDLNQYCLTFNGTSAYCTTTDINTLQAAYNQAVAAGNAAGLTGAVPGVTYNASQGTPNFRFPFQQVMKFHKLLPNAGATFRIGEPHLLYINYAAGFSAPKTDNLYTSATALVKPETSETYSAGYRYQAHSITASISAYDTEYKNRIVQSFDPNDASLSIDRNVGDVSIKGVDAEFGVQPVRGLSLYASATFEDSKIKSDYTIVVSGKTTQLPTKGKELVLTPARQFSGRAEYNWGPVTAGLQGKYTSARWISDVNDDRVPGYATFDADLRFDVTPKVSLQANVSNLFNRFYISRVSTVQASKGVVTSAGTLSPGTPFFYVGAPRTFNLTLDAKF